MAALRADQLVVEEGPIDARLPAETAASAATATATATATNYVPPAAYCANGTANLCPVIPSFIGPDPMLDVGVG